MNQDAPERKEFATAKFQRQAHDATDFLE